MQRRKEAPGASPGSDHAIASDNQHVHLQAPAQTSDDRGSTVFPEPGRTWLGSKTAALAFGVLLIPQVFMPGVHWRDVILASDAYHSLFAGMDERVMPERVGGFERVGFRTESRARDSSWGEFSRFWSFRGQGSSLTVSLDYDFVDWHELTACYEGRGWTVYDRRVVDGSTSPSGRDGRGPAVVARYSTSKGGTGTRSGDSTTASAGRSPLLESKTTLRLLRERLSSWGESHLSGPRDNAWLSYQLQVFHEGETEPSPETLADIHELFAEARSRAERAASGQGGPEPRISRRHPPPCLR